jgi:hypothetical protein
MVDVNIDKLSLWDVRDVCQWLNTWGLSTLRGNWSFCFFFHELTASSIFIEIFEKNDVDGALLISMDDTFIRDSLGVLNALLRKKLMRQVQLLKEKRDAKLKVFGLISLICLREFYLGNFF